MTDTGSDGPSDFIEVGKIYGKKIPPVRGQTVFLLAVVIRPEAAHQGLP